MRGLFKKVLFFDELKHECSSQYIINISCFCTIKLILKEYLSYAIDDAETPGIHERLLDRNLFFHKCKNIHKHK